MTKEKVAFPGTILGLDGELSGHFGHSEAFILIEYDTESKNVESVEILRNEPHEHGMCMRPVMLLKNSGINSIVVGGIGKRPLQGFMQVGIKAYAGIKGTVRENFIKYIEGDLEPVLKETCDDKSHY